VTPFRFEHDFRAASPAPVFEAYFDLLRRVCKVSPRRQLPAVVRPFVDGDLSYVERVAWHKAEDRIDMSIEPSVLGGRVEILATYRLALVEPGVVRRTYEGHVSVQVRLVGGRIERGIVDDLGRTLITAASCTQQWLDARGPGILAILGR
jgi:hypothetical protein